MIFTQSRTKTIEWLQVGNFQSYLEEFNIGLLPGLVVFEYIDESSHSNTVYQLHVRPHVQVHHPYTRT